MLFRKSKYVPSGSLGKLAWKKFTSNTLGMISMGTILFAILIALLGYLITPDKTPYSNRQLLEISMQKPGFSVRVLKIPNTDPGPGTGCLSAMFTGKKSDHQQIPVSAYRFADDKILVNVFDGEGNSRVLDLKIADIIYPDHKHYIYQDGMVQLTDSENNPVVEDTNLLRKRLESDHLVWKKYWLGTDQFGRDLLSRLIIGSRISLSVGFISVAISLLVGMIFGALAGYFGGRTDEIIMWFINVIWSVPTLLLVIAITFALGKGFWQIFIAVGLTMWVEVARVVRGQIISLREKEFVEAARALGYSNARIIANHIVPNVLSPVIVISAANFAAAILIEAGLSFLGIGVQPPLPSWGGMIKEYYNFIILDYAYLAIIPGLAIVILVLAFMTLGNILRDALDVKVTV